MYCIAFMLLIFALTSCGDAELEDAVETPDVPEIEAPVAADTPSPAETPDPGDTPDDNGDAADEPPPAIEEDFAFAYGDFIIMMDQDINEILEALGEPLGIFEAPSCAFDGIDIIFRFPGIQIHTYPRDDGDFVHTISLRDDSVKTMEGIYLGDGPDKVFDRYGSDYEAEFDMYTFTRGMTTLSFVIEDDIVVAITYGLIIQ